MTNITLTAAQISSQLYMGRVFVALDGKVYNNYKKMLQFDKKYNRNQEMNISLSEDKETMTEVK